MLAFNLTTGALIPGFAPVLNNQARTVTASPDGSRIYVGGQFNQVNGINRYRIAALDPATGAVISTGTSRSREPRTIIRRSNPSPSCSIRCR